MDFSEFRQWSKEFLDRGNRLPLGYEDYCSSPLHIYWILAKSRALTDVFGSIQISGKKILDLGTGDASLVIQLAERGAALCVGTELYEDAVRQATARVAAVSQDVAKRIRIVKSDAAQRLDFDSHSFDMVTAIGVLGYLADPGSALREIVRVCAPGGHVILTFYNGEGPHWVAKRGARFMRRLARSEDAIDYRPMRLRTIRRITESAGIEFSSEDGFVVLPPVLRSLVGRSQQQSATLWLLKYLLKFETNPSSHWLRKRVGRTVLFHGRVTSRKTL